MQYISLHSMNLGFNSSLSLISIIFTLVVSIVIITLHELLRAFLSHKLGDPMPKKDKRLTLNPISHIEPIGLILMVITGYGWGKPLDSAPVYYKNKKRDTLITYLVPIVFIFLLSISMAGISKVLWGFLKGSLIYMDNGMHTVYIYMYYFFTTFAITGMRFAIFNLIPVYPLNGYRILNVFLSPNNVIKMVSYEKIFQILMILVLFLGGIDLIINPIVRLFIRW